MIRTAKLVVVLAMILSIAGCGGAGPDAAGEAAAGFSVTTLEGDEFNLADKRGEVVGLYFMAAY